MFDLVKCWIVAERVLQKNNHNKRFKGNLQSCLLLVINKEQKECKFTSVWIQNQILIWHKNLTFCSNLLIKSNHLLLPGVPCSAFLNKGEWKQRKRLAAEKFSRKINSKYVQAKTIFPSAAGWGHFWKWNENSKHPRIFARVVLGKHLFLQFVILQQKLSEIVWLLNFAFVWLRLENDSFSWHKILEIWRFISFSEMIRFTKKLDSPNHISDLPPDPLLL